MMNKITVIGSGNVGSTIAYTLTIMGIASEIVMIDVNEEKSLGEALDIRQGVSFCNPVSVYAGSYADAVNSDIVVITSGMARKPGQSRLDLAQANVDIIKSIADKIVPVAPKATYVIVSNPVDVLTYVFLKHTGLPQERVIGSGTVLDTARLRSRISEYYSVNQKNVHAYVLGEHGDSSFVPWSLANISNVPVETFSDAIQTKEIYPEFILKDVEDYMRKSGARIIQRKGATFYAVSISVCHICKSILSGIDTTLTVSTMLNGEYGIDDVCLSLLNVVGDKGAHAKIMLPLNEEETAALHNSAKVLKDLINSLDI
ncbi:MAG: L-lactate dehydrogenase [Clostridia bacterium]|nr:L-lactate dehydrogenase [Clostridia bacterium]